MKRKLTAIASLFPDLQSPSSSLLSSIQHSIHSFVCSYSLSTYLLGILAVVRGVRRYVLRTAFWRLLLLLLLIAVSISVTRVLRLLLLLLLFTTFLVLFLRGKVLAEGLIDGH